MNVRYVIAFTLSTCATLPAYAGVTVTNAWIKLTAPEQTTAEVYMQIKSDTTAKLTGVSSPVAKIAQIHEMKMNGNAMQMRAINSLELPAGRIVELKPGGYHIMLAELGQPLREGAAVPLILTIESADQPNQSIGVKAEVRSAMSVGKHDDMKGMGDMGGMKGM